MNKGRMRPHAMGSSASRVFTLLPRITTMPISAFPLTSTACSNQGSGRQTTQGEVGVAGGFFSFMLKDSFSKYF